MNGVEPLFAITQVIQWIHIGQMASIKKFNFEFTRNCSGKSSLSTRYPMNPSNNERLSPARQGVALHAAPQPQPMPPLTSGARLRVEDRGICNTAL